MSRVIGSYQVWDRFLYCKGLRCQKIRLFPFLSTVDPSMKELPSSNTFELAIHCEVPSPNQTASTKSWGDPMKDLGCWGVPSLTICNQIFTSVPF